MANKMKLEKSIMSLQASLDRERTAQSGNSQQITELESKQPSFRIHLHDPHENARQNFNRMSQPIRNVWQSFRLETIKTFLPGGWSSFCRLVSTLSDSRYLYCRSEQKASFGAGNYKEARIWDSLWEGETYPEQIQHGEGE